MTMALEGRGLSGIRVLTQSEGRTWLQRYGLPEPDESLADQGFFDEAAYVLPKDAGRKTALARLILTHLDVDENEGMFWITGYGVWPSSENQSLFYVVRWALGDRRTLAEAPCHVFNTQGREGLEWLLDVSLYFSWDATLFSPHQGIVLRLSHDEVLQLYGSRSDHFSDFDRALSDFKLNPV